MEGGCTAPIGALASIEHDNLHFEGVLLSLDGKQKLMDQKIYFPRGLSPLWQVVCPRNIGQWWQGIDGGDKKGTGITPAWESQTKVS